MNEIESDEESKHSKGINVDYDECMTKDNIIIVYNNVDVLGPLNELS